MALSTYTELKAAVASWLHRTDLTTEIIDFIALAEADMQVRAKLGQWDTSATVTLTTGSGALPTDFAHANSVKYAVDDYTLDFLPMARFDAVAADDESGSPICYTIRGANLLVYPRYTGDVTLAYTARFTQLSGSVSTNSILALFPDTYLNGSLAFACAWLQDDAQAQKYGGLFDQAIGRIRKYMLDYKYPDTLQMRVA